VIELDSSNCSIFSRIGRPVEVLGRIAKIGLSENEWRARCLLIYGVKTQEPDAA
jgi:hypothetical protein